ncbi:DMT family transporter [Oleispirillum naphthae]|uniref:DMT family transporter n=1 Tax=Oleispirillum naphthae TaxID=2838853 RepID=UPI003082340F
MRRLYANLLLLTAALIWGVTFSIQQMAMRHIGPITFTGLRFLMGAAAVLPFALAEARAKRRNGWRLEPAALPWLALTGSVLFSAALLQQIGIAGTSVANAGFLTALYVPLTPILGFLVLRHAPHPAIWAAAAACVAGAYLMSGGALDTLREGDAWVLAGSVFWACHILLIGAMTARLGAPFVISCVQFAVCGALGTVWGLTGEPFHWGMAVAAWPMLAFSGLMSVGVGFTLQVVGQRHTPAADASIILSGETVFAAIAGAILLGERLSPLELQGCALILGGVLAVELLPLTLGRLKRPRPLDAP